jgi:hypothetical protein
MTKKTMKKSKPASKKETPLVEEVEPNLLVLAIINRKFLAKWIKLTKHIRIKSHDICFCGIYTTGEPFIFELQVILTNEDSLEDVDTDDDDYRIFYDEKESYESILQLIPHFDAILKSEQCLYPVFSCGGKKKKKVLGAVECYAKPLLEGSIGQDEEGFHVFQLLKTIGSDPDHPFYLHTTFCPDPEYKRPNHCIKSGNLDRTGIGYCSGQILTFDDVINFLNDDEGEYTPKISAIFGLILI